MTNKPAIDVFSNRDAYGGLPFLVTDKFGRLRMSAGLITLLGCKDSAIRLYIGYDHANRRIALGKPDVVKPTDANAVNFDKLRHYTTVRRFFEKHALPYEPTRFVYDGKYEGWFMFRWEEYDSTDRRGT